MQIKFDLLKKGDEVLNTWDNKISIKRKNGEVEIFMFDLDEDNLPRLSDKTILISYGSGVISIKKEDSDFEMGTF
jgi:hypothetical protein